MLTMSTPDSNPPAPRQGPPEAGPTTGSAPPTTSELGAEASVVDAVDRAPEVSETLETSEMPDDGAVPDGYGLPEPPDRGAQHAFDAPPAAPPESESYPWPVAAAPPPPPPPTGWQPGPQAWPYAGGHPAPTPYESPIAYPYPAGWAPGRQAPPEGASVRPGAYGPPSGGYSTPTGAYPPYGYVGVDPYAKSRTVAGILGILIGGLGVHRFYLGYVGIGVLQIVVTVLTFGVGAIWGFVEGILYLTQRTGQFAVDATGRPLRE
jgi:TM2 domain-containing membrane protein YozV